MSANLGRVPAVSIIGAVSTKGGSLGPAQRFFRLPLIPARPWEIMHV